MVVLRPKGECIDAPPYKDQGGKWRTSSLFYETFPRDLWEKFTPIFTLNEFQLNITKTDSFYPRYAPDPQGPVVLLDGSTQERHPIPSLRHIYLRYNDPTEYTFATDVFKSTYHWKHLCGLKWFQPYLAEWRATLREKLRGIGIARMVDIAQGSDPKLALNAAKWVAEGSFTERKEKGRPSDEKVEVQLNKEAQIERIYREDAQRVGVEVPRESHTEDSMPDVSSTRVQ